MKTKLKPRKTAIQKRSQETVDAILESTTRILIKDGTEAVSTNKIAEIAGVSIGSLYQYFPSKESIFNALIVKHLNWKLGVVEKHIQDMVSSPQTTDEMIESLVELVIELKVKNLRLERALIFFFSRSGDFEMLRKIDEQVIQKFAQILDPLKGRIPAFDPDWTVFVLYHSLRSLIISVSTARPHEVKSPKLKKEMIRLVKGYLLLQNS